jgi:ArsR family transcriptional regulator
MNKTLQVSGIDLMFRAFSDRTRLRILHLLQCGEMCVGDLVTVLDVPQSKASRHLAYLRKSRLVTVRRDGLWCYYSLAPAANSFQENLLNCLETCFNDVPEIKSDARRKTKLRKSGGCCSKDRKKS